MESPGDGEKGATGADPSPDPSPDPSSDPSTDPAGDAFAVAVDRVLRSLPRGEVVTYGEVAAEAGRPGAARAVGRLLATSGGAYPWWRVVTAAGRLVPGAEAEHGRRLVAEGVAVVDGRVRGMAGRTRRESDRSPGS